MILTVPRLIRQRFHKRLWCYTPRAFAQSNKPLTVMMPLASKDIHRAGLAIESIRRHVMHPISDVVVVGEDDDAIREFCRNGSVRYINEDEVLPPSVNDPRIIKGGALRVRGWVRQQLLKLTAFDYIQADTILAYDADTYLVRDLAFFEDDQPILFLSDEYTGRYEYLIKFLLGPVKRHPRSFVAHFMVLQRDVMKRLHEKVLSNCGLTLCDAILSKLDIANAGLSEFEIYGNYMNSFEPEGFVTRYWYNQKVPPNRRFSLNELEAIYRRFNSVSAHEH